MMDFFVLPSHLWDDIASVLPSFSIPIIGIS